MFSAAEEAVIKILGRRKMTIHEITCKYYGRPESEQPSMDPENYIGRVVRRIAKKCAHHNLTWTIVGSRSVLGRTVWRAPNKKKRKAC